MANPYDGITRADILATFPPGAGRELWLKWLARQHHTLPQAGWTPASAPPYDSPVTFSQWKCRLCGFDRYYHQVSVLRKTGARYETSFYACSRCSVMFLNPSQFDANGTANPNVEAPPAVVTPMRRKG